MHTLTRGAGWILGMQAALDADLLVRLLSRLRFLLLLGRSVLTPWKLVMQSVGTAVSRVLLAVGLRIVWPLETEGADCHGFLGIGGRGSPLSHWSFDPACLRFSTFGIRPEFVRL